MNRAVKKSKDLLKTAVSCIVILIFTAFVIMAPKLPAEKQSFDIRTAIVISVGAAAVICLATAERKPS